MSSCHIERITSRARAIRGPSIAPSSPARTSTISPLPKQQQAVNRTSTGPHNSRQQTTHWHIWLKAGRRRGASDGIHNQFSGSLTMWQAPQRVPYRGGRQLERDKRAYITHQLLLYDGVVVVEVMGMGESAHALCWCCWCFSCWLVWWFIPI